MQLMNKDLTVTFHTRATVSLYLPLFTTRRSSQVRAGINISLCLLTYIYIYALYIHIYLSYIGERESSLTLCHLVNNGSKFPTGAYNL